MTSAWLPLAALPRDFRVIPARILTCGEPPWPNARTFSLEIMRREARYPILVTSDSDVSVGPDYLASVVAPLADPNVGMVTCLYRGVTRHGLWAQLEAMGMSIEMTSGVLVAEMLEGMQLRARPFHGHAPKHRGKNRRLRAGRAVLRRRLCAGQLDRGRPEKPSFSPPTSSSTTF